MSLKLWRAVGVAMALAAHPAPAQAVSARELVVLARPGTSFDDRASDQDRCRQIASNAPEEDLPRDGWQAGAGGYGGYAGGGLEVAIGSVIAYAILGAMETASARDRAEIFCMSNLGYVGVPLTAAETAEFRRLRGARRTDWERAFLAQDLTSRIEPLRTPAVPPLPAYGTEPATLGGLRIDLASLTAAPAPIVDGGSVASGKVVRARTAELTQAFETVAGPVRLSGIPGAVFHQVDYRPQRDPLLRDRGATWCGAVSETGPQGPANQPWCFTTFDNGYGVFRPTGYVWLAGPYRDGIVLPRYTTPIMLRERESDDLGELDFEIRAADIGRTRVRLEGVVKLRGRTVRIWNQEMRLMSGGSAILPLWSRRLIVSRAGDALTATIDDQGDGQGLR